MTKQKITWILIVLVSLLSIIYCKSGGGGSDSKEPDTNSVCTIDGEQISIARFKKEYKYHIKINYPEGRQELLRDDKDEMEKYFQRDFLPKMLFVKYAKRLDMFKDAKMLEKAKKYFEKLGLIQYTIFLKAQSKYKEPDDSTLKQFNNDLKSRPEKRMQNLSKRLSKLPWNKKRVALLRLHKQYVSNKLTMEYIEKIRQENRLIKNDDLEKDLIKKYVNAQISLDKIMADNDKKYWLIKFNEKIISAKDVEKEIQFLIFMNSGKNKLEEYKKDIKKQKSYRKLMWPKQEMHWMVYYQALKKGFENTEDGKFFMETIKNSSLSKMYIMKKIATKVEKPTENEIKEMYNKLKQRAKNSPPLNKEAKEYITAQIKKQKAQKKMLQLFNRLKGRHVIIVNEDFFKSAEEREAEKTKKK